MGGLSASLAQELRDALGLRRAIETGTLHGGGARLIAEIFPEAVSIELSAELHARAAEALAEVSNVTLLQGDSRLVLPPLVDAGRPTLYFLDGHWSGGETAGQEDECPVLDELAALRGGHPDDCVIIDDARLFESAPPPPHDPGDWPSIERVLDAIRAVRPDHEVVVAHDQVVAVPPRARHLIELWMAGRLDAPARRLRRRLRRRRG